MTNKSKTMRSTKRVLVTFVLGLALTITTSETTAQGPGAPPPPDHGTSGNQSQGGRGAPIGGGLFVLLGLGGAYGGFKGYKWYQEKKKGLLE